MKIGTLRAVEVENRPLLLTRPMAYTTACTTLQAVINMKHALADTISWQLADLNELLHSCLQFVRSDIGQASTRPE